MIQNAAYWQKEGSQIRCNLCPHHCLLSKGKKGICSVRLNEAGTLKTENFGEITAMHIDPVEKNLYIILNQAKEFYQWELMDVICHVIFAKITL